MGYVPFNSESLVTGKLFEDIRDAVYDMAKPEDYDAIVVTNLCVPTASGVPLRLLPDEINGVRIIGIDVPGFGVPTHAEAKDVLAGAMLAYARNEAEQGPVAGAPRRSQGQADGDPRRRDVPGRSGGHRHDARAPRTRGRARGAHARMARALCGAGLRGGPPRSIPSTRPSFREFEAAGRQIVGSAPVGVDGTAAWLENIGATCNVPTDRIEAAKQAFLPAIQGALAGSPIDGRITLSGYEGSELLVARLLIESGADVRYVGTACPADAPFGSGSRVARSEGRARTVPRLAGAGHRGHGGVQA